MDIGKVGELKEFIEACKSNPSLLHTPSLSFFKSYLLSLGANIPPQPKTEPVVVDDHDIIESDIELDNTDVVKPDNDPPQKMGNPSAQVTDDQRDAAQLAKSKALDALSQGFFDQALDLLTQAILLNPHSSILYATRDMVHPDVFTKQVVSLNVQGVVVSPNVQGVVVKAVDVGNDFKNKQEFQSRDQMLEWIHMETCKLGFGVVIGRSNNGSNRRCTFVTMTCERSGKYQTPLRNFKRDDTSTRKCECPFKVRSYMLANKNWRFNVIRGLHNHDLCLKLADHPTICRIKPKEKECVADMTLNLVQPKNILATLKRK